MARMSETKPSPYYQFAPENRLVAADVVDLMRLERGIIAEMSPDLNMAELNDDGTLRDAVMPRNFHGKLLEITLDPMDKPFTQLCTARERGWKFSGVNLASILPEEQHSPDIQTVGFVFNAVASSSRKKDVGPVQAEIWYTNATYDRELRRFVTNPQYHKQLIDKMHSDARRMGAVAAMQRTGGFIPRQPGAGERDEA